MQKFTTEDADRLLGLGDQFLEDWAAIAATESGGDPDFDERYEEWKAIRPLLVQAPALLKALEAWAFADADPEAARRKGYYNHAREQRDALLRQLGSNAVGPAKARGRQ